MVATRAEARRRLTMVSCAVVPGVTTVSLTTQPLVTTRPGHNTYIAGWERPVNPGEKDKGEAINTSL